MASSTLLDPDLIDLKLDWQDEFVRDFKDPPTAIKEFFRRAEVIKKRHQALRKQSLPNRPDLDETLRERLGIKKSNTEVDDLKEAYQSLKYTFKPSEYKALHYPARRHPAQDTFSSVEERDQFLRNKEHLDDLLAIKGEAPTLPDEFSNPYATRIPIMSILTLHPTKENWEAKTREVLTASIIHRKGLTAQIMYLNCLRNTKMNEVFARDSLLRNTTCEAALAHNQHAWVNFINHLPTITTETLKRATWCQLLEDEYNGMTREWLFFWNWVEECKAANIEYREKEIRFCALLKEHCKKKGFLQDKIAESNDLVLPALYHWWAELEWLELDCKTISVEEDGETVARPVFFTRGNAQFAEHCRVVQTLEWEDK
ncbi:hypothetical protein LTR84_000088 [Exophiala bonariae]|uniref:Uncharacterized protein n=1 Tax=Exophiala bonariae TaxID=1690606 RepID=A0AAV9NQ31_9EURO|nr:hypothetical protein LTR84_000088 [Exophiala bonariae]